jgi:putative DNA primase/helicase
MSAEAIAKALGGRKVGTTWMAKCPAHADRMPSLSVKDAGCGSVLLHCHAGCLQRQVIAALKARGLWQGVDRRHGTPTSPRQSTASKTDLDDTVRRTKAALRMWASAVPAEGTLVEAYLHSRGILMPVPAALRFHAGIRHPFGGFWPAMIALVTRGEDGTPLGIHRTFLARDGYGQAPVEPRKMMLGPCRGGVVRFGEDDRRLMAAEGIETALAALQSTGRAAWAALSTSGMRTLELPAGIRDLVITADGDAAGEAAASDAARRLKREGRCIFIARAPRGFDFNDVLLGRIFRHAEDEA